MAFSTIVTGLKVSEEIPILKKAEVVFLELSVRSVRPYGVHMKAESLPTLIYLFY